MSKYTDSDLDTRRNELKKELDDIDSKRASKAISHPNYDYGFYKSSKECLIIMGVICGIIILTIIFSLYITYITVLR